MVVFDLVDDSGEVVSPGIVGEFEAYALRDSLNELLGVRGPQCTR